jgi:cell wall-associated NlpC family hydrolase
MNMGAFGHFHIFGKALLLLLLIAIELGASGCESVPTRQTSIDAHRTNKTKVDETRLEVVGTALAQLGTPYAYGGSTPQTGFDCSGLVQYSHKNAGVQVPRTVTELFSQAHRKDLHNVLPGDLLFFHTSKSNHVGIYLGNGEFIHAPSGGKYVSLSSIYRPYWREHLTAAGSYL